MSIETDPPAKGEAIDLLTPESRARFAAYTRAVAGGVAVKRDLHFRNQFRRILETGQRPAPGIDLWALLAGLTMPTLFVRGRQSDMFSAETRDRIVRDAPRAEIVELDTSHDVIGEDPDGLARAAAAFLARHAL